MPSAIMQTYARQSIAFERGEGAWLTATDGRRYLDGLSGISVCNLGHAHPAVHQALCRQSQKLLHTSNLYQIPLQEELAAQLARLAAMDAVFFGNSGAEANEVAIKLCRKWGADNGIDVPLIVTMEGGFHGRTMATLTATGNDKIKRGFQPLLPGFLQIPYDNIPALEQLLAANQQIVAVMLEPILGEGGVVAPAAGYLAAVRRLCDQHHCLMVADEVQTGLGRTGRWFAHQHEAVIPDVVTLAKSLGNGVPIGACMAAGQAGAALRPGEHGSTFGGNPLAASAALAVLRVLQQDELPARVQQLGQAMLSEFKQRLAGRPLVRAIRGKGLMLGIELARPCAELVAAAQQRGLLINVTATNVIRLLPPFIISDAEAEMIIDIVSDVVSGFAASD